MNKIREVKLNLKNETSMISEPSRLFSVENAFLSSALEAKQPLAIYLKNGVKLKGLLVGFDENMLFLKDSHETVSAIFKHATSTVVPIGMG